MFCQAAYFPQVCYKMLILQS